MSIINVSKTTDGPSPVVAGSVIHSTVTIANDSPSYSNDYAFQIGMGDWVQRVPSVAPGVNTLGSVGIRFFNAGAIASLNGALVESGDALWLRNFVAGDLNGNDASISFVARVYNGVNNFAPLIATFPGTMLASGDAVITSFPGTNFYIEVEALAPNVLMHSISVGEVSDDIVATVLDAVPNVPAGVTRMWTATHSLSDDLLPATDGTGAINWSNVVLPAGSAITISIDDTVPNAGNYQNDVAITAGVDDTGIWSAQGQQIVVNPPPPVLSDCDGAVDIQARQAYVRGSLFGVVTPAYGQFRVYNAGTTNLVFTSDPIPGDGNANQDVEAVVPFGAGVLMPNTAYDFVLEVYDATGTYVNRSSRCSFTTQAEYSYANCGAAWGDPVRHAVLVSTPPSALVNDSGQGRVGPVGHVSGSTAFSIAYEVWNGVAWVAATTKVASANTYGAPGAIANPAVLDVNGPLPELGLTNLRGDGQIYEVRKTVRNSANQIVEQRTCQYQATARVPPLQCADTATAINDNGATLVFGPIDRNQYAFAEQDNIKVQARRAGTNEPFQTVGQTTLPNGDATAQDLDTVAIPISGLMPGTAYDTRVVYTSDPGFPATGYTGAVCNATFTTTGQAPIVDSAECSGASAITLTSATVNGSASSDDGLAHLEWGTSPTGPFPNQSPPVAINGSNVALTANATGLSPATRYYFRVVMVDPDTNAVIAQSVVCEFATRTPSAFISPVSSAECPPTEDVEEAEPPMDVTVTHTFTHFSGTDPITGDVHILLTSEPPGSTIISWTATTTGAVTGSALAGATDPDETITMAPGASITYEVVYHVPGPTGGGLNSTSTFDGPGADQIWQSTASCHIRNMRTDCEPAFLDLTAIPRDTNMRQFIYDGVTYNLTLDAGWTVEELVNALNAQTPGKFAVSDDGNILLNPQTRWAHGNATFTYIVDPTLIDFGTGGTDGNRVTSPDTTYTFEPDGMILDGFYAITSFQDTGLASFNTNAGNITADATGDPNGNAMIFNASFAPGEFARITIPTTAGLTYGTSFWVVNTNDPTIDVIQPNVTVRFEDSNGNSLGTVSTGDVSPPAVWKQFLADVVAADAQTTFVFVNNAPGGGGNDLALDQIEAGAFVTDSIPFVQGQCPPERLASPPPLQCVTAACIAPTPWPFALPPCTPPCPVPAPSAE